MKFIGIQNLTQVVAKGAAKLPEKKVGSMKNTGLEIGPAALGVNRTKCQNFFRPPTLTSDCFGFFKGTKMHSISFEIGI